MMIGGYSIKMSVGFHALLNPISMPGQKRITQCGWWNGHPLMAKLKKH